MINNTQIQGKFRTYDITYGQGPKGQAGFASVNVTNDKTGLDRSYGIAGATNGEQSVVVSGRKNNNTGNSQVNTYASGPNGTATSTVVRGPENIGYRAAVHGENFSQVWSGYLPR